MKESRSRFDISSAGLHLLGMVIMLMDHTWATIATGHSWLTWVGRIAFPIFASAPRISRAIWAAWSSSPFSLRSPST